MKRLIASIMALAALVSCANDESKVLVLYYSQTGVTEKVALEIQAQTDADIERFDVEEVYDGDFDATIQRCLVERETGFVPTLKPIVSDLSEYDVIFLGYPVWFGTYAPPVAALLASENLEGKKIVPFCTFGSGGLSSSMNDLKEALPQCEVVQGYGIRTVRVDNAGEELDRFLIENGFKEGELEVLPPFSEQQELSPEEEDIFYQAVGDYPFPIGYPQTVGSRDIPGGREYHYYISSKDRDGYLTDAQLFILCKDGCEPEFTQVVR